jgi:hypothetical protein
MNHYRNGHGNPAAVLHLCCSLLATTHQARINDKPELGVNTDALKYKAWVFDNAHKPVKRKKSLQFNMLTDSIEVIS